MDATGSRRTTARHATRRTLAGVAAVLALAGCSSANGVNGASGPGTSSAASAGGGAEVVGTATSDLGTYLTADGGRSVYLWEGDSAGVSNCTSACASVWPPVLTSGEPQASDGVDASLLGTVSRPDGSLQVTYQGWPLYYFAHDTSAGQTTGEGSTGFGAAWWLVAPSGAAITGGASSSPSSSPAASRGGYGY